MNDLQKIYGENPKIFPDFWETWANAVSIVEEDGQYFEKNYRDENLSDWVHDAAVKAIKTISADP